jgi:hypothetical protein
MPLLARSVPAPGAAKEGTILDADAVTDLILALFDDVDVVEAWGSKFFYLLPHGAPPDPKDVYFASISLADSEHDSASQLDRDGVFRLNVGVSRVRFLRLFGAAAMRADANRDYAAFDTLMPHPVYGGAAWVCVVNPSAATIGSMTGLLEEAYEWARRRRTAARRAD